MIVQRNIKFTSSIETIPLICLDFRIRISCINSLPVEPNEHINCGINTPLLD